MASKNVTLNEIETAIKVLSTMDAKERGQFVSSVDELKNLHGKELDARISKKGSTGGLMVTRAY
jgi:hypothetical protein